MIVSPKAQIDLTYLVLVINASLKKKEKIKPHFNNDNTTKKRPIHTYTKTLAGFCDQVRLRDWKKTNVKK